MYVMTDY